MVRGEGSRSNRGKQPIVEEDDIEIDENVEFDMIVHSPDRPELSWPQPNTERIVAPGASPKWGGRSEESREVENPSPENWCTMRFIDWRAHRTYGPEKDPKVTVTAEKPFPSDGLPERLMEVFEREKIGYWNALLSGHASSDLVREIYANAFCYDAREGTFHHDKRVIFCRLEWIVISPATIATVLRFPALEKPCAFQAALSDPIRFPQVKAAVDSFCFRPEVPPNYTQMGGVRKWKAHGGDFTAEARWLCEVIACWVYGYSNLTYYSFEMMLISYCLYQGERVDIPEIIYKSFHSRIGPNKKRHYGHAFLLKTIARLQDVLTVDHERLLPPRGERKFLKTKEAVDDRVAPKGPAARRTKQGPSESELVREMRLSREMAASHHAESMYYMQDGFRQLGMEVSRLGRQVRELGAAQNHPWASGVPETWEYVPPVYPPPPPEQPSQPSTRAGQPKSKKSRGGGSSSRA